MSSTAAIVLMTGDRLRHQHVANRLAERFDVRGVVLEHVFEPPLPDDASARAVLERHFAERDRAEGRFFGRETALAVEEARQLRIAKGEANSPRVAEWVQERRPDYLVLFGSGIIGAALLHAFDGRCFNLHLGLSPYYRGSATNFWPLVNREPELVGATVHVATRAIDGGPILRQARPMIERGDRNHEIGCKAIIAGATALVEGLEALHQGVPAVPQQGDGRLCKRADFTPAAVETMWRQFETGMIEEYLAQPDRARRYPIIERDAVSR